MNDEGKIMNAAISALGFSRRRSCQLLVIFRLSTTFLRGVTAKQAVLRLHRMENRTCVLRITEILQLRRNLKSQSGNYCTCLIFIRIIDVKRAQK